ncbi:unnamed protein product, partial [Ectocarpus fasciculatus]
QLDAWVTLRGDLDKVQMGVATPDQLRGTFAAANAPTGPPPPPPPPRALADAPPPPLSPRDGPSGHPSQDGRAQRERKEEERAGRRSHPDKARESTSRRARGRGVATPSPPREGLHISVQLPLKPDPPGYGALSVERTGRAGRADRARPGDHIKGRSPSPRGGRRRSPGNSRRERERERERDRRGRKRDRERDRGVTRSREREWQGGERSGRDPRRGSR